MKEGLRAAPHTLRERMLLSVCLAICRTVCFSCVGARLPSKPPPCHPQTSDASAAPSPHPYMSTAALDQYQKTRSRWLQWERSPTLSELSITRWESATQVG